MESKKVVATRRGGRLVHHGLEGGSIKIMEHEAVTVMIDKRSKIS